MNLTDGQPDTQTLYQLQDNGYTVIWAPLLFVTVIALSLVGILVPLWEFLFQRKAASQAVSVVSLYNDGAELEQVSEMRSDLKEHLADLLDRPPRGTKGWRDLATQLGYHYEVKLKAADRPDSPPDLHISPTITLLHRWQFTNTATVENLLKSLHSIERSDAAGLVQSECNVVLIECLTTV